MSDFRTVTKEAFFAFLASYPNQSRLHTGTTTIGDPPVRHYFDNSLPTKGVIGSTDYFFDTEVARIVLDWMGPNGQVTSDDTFYEYKIKEGL